MRKPIERTNRGQYVEYPDRIEEFARNVAEELCKKYPDVDILDLEFIFEKQFSFGMSLEMLKYGAKVDKEEKESFNEQCEQEDREIMDWFDEHEGDAE